LIALEQKSEEVQRQRRNWKRKIRQVDLKRFWFLDEAGAHTKMTRLYGRALRGQRVFSDVPGGRWKTWTMLSAINVNGVVPTMVYEGGTDIVAMETFVRWQLLPELSSGDIVVMDNLGAHKSRCVLDHLESVGAKAWFLPTYSPDWNPIEHIWSKVKAILKRIAPRSDNQLMSAIGTAINAISKADIINSALHCGYAHNDL